MSKHHGRSLLLSLLLSPLAKRNGRGASSPAVPHQIPAPRPAGDDHNAWHAYWQAQGQPWRTEPEISKKRQQELEQGRAIVPDIERGIYPFKDMRLSRADVEWLLAIHESGQGPVDWSDKTQLGRVGLDLRGTDLRQVDLQNLPLARILGGLPWDEWEEATDDQRDMAAIHLERADLRWAHLDGAFLRSAHLERANLVGVSMKRAFLMRAHLENADLRWAHLEQADLEEAHLNDEEHIGPQLVDVQWTGVNLAQLDWASVKMLGDEYKARQKKRDGKVKSRGKRLKENEIAVRATRQIAVALQNQGLNEEAARFTYRAQVLQRRVLWFLMLQHNMKFRHRMQVLGAWLFSWFLFLLAGYGYKPSRSFLAYFLVISGFATAYYLLGHTVGPALSPLGAFVFSMTSFHGRGFFPGNNILLDDPLTVLAALEALVGLIIEVTFIATVTQRFFNR
jgi:uncharacterized protein YjbI with pentapeptide repeats